MAFRMACGCVAVAAATAMRGDAGRWKRVSAAQEPAAPVAPPRHEPARAGTSRHEPACSNRRWQRMPAKQLLGVRIAA